jgi:hypothetical protein
VGAGTRALSETPKRPLGRIIRRDEDASAEVTRVYDSEPFGNRDLAPKMRYSNV